jgi:hypothetical protein
MTFPRAVIERVVTLWTMGQTAEETVAALRSEGVRIGLQTVYRMRHGFTATDLLDELLRLQLRAIEDCPKIALQMEYRDRLLGRLMKQCATQKTGGALNWRAEMVSQKPIVGKQPLNNYGASYDDEYVRKLLTE